MIDRNALNSQRLGRRELLRYGVRALGATALSVPLFGATACDGSERRTGPERQPDRRAGATGPVRDVRLVAEPGEVEVGPRTIYRTWLYNGQFPGPEIRVREGERLRIRIDNRLPDAGTTVHWHGIPLPNAMDGVPGLTQDPIPPGGAMVY